MIRLLLLHGHATDPEAIDRHYCEVHIPIAKKDKGLKKWIFGKVTATPDGSPPPCRIADLYMESNEEFESLLGLTGRLGRGCRGSEQFDR